MSCDDGDDHRCLVLPQPCFPYPNVGKLETIESARLLLFHTLWGGTSSEARDSSRTLGGGEPDTEVVAHAFGKLRIGAD